MKKAICDWLAVCHRDITFWENSSTGIYDPVRKIFRKNTSKYFLAGTSDLLGFFPDGRILAIEVKSYRGVHSQEQIDFIARVNRAGGVGLFAKTIHQVKEVIDAEKAKVLRAGRAVPGNG